MTGQFLPLARTEHLIVQHMNNEVILYDSASDKAHVLNESAALVWKLANGKRTVEQLTRLVAREQHTQPDADLVWLALTQLSKANLLAQPAFAVPLSAQVTRREFLQKAALAAAVIPVVKTISAPAADQVASCLFGGTPCVSDPQCCSGVCTANICECFVAGTVLTFGDGTKRAIETIQIGDLVLARDEKTGIMAPQPVEKIYIHPERQAFQLHFDDGTVSTTAMHPFYTETGWTQAIDLRAGVDCVLENGAHTTLRSVEHTQSNPQTVYNLQVSGFHTYFVGNAGVWVHNKS